MDGDVEITFTGDSTQLNAAIALAKVQLAALTQQTKFLAEAMTNAGQTGDSKFLASLEEKGAKARSTKDAIASLNDEIKSLSTTGLSKAFADDAKAAATAMAGYEKELKSVQALSAAGNAEASAAAIARMAARINEATSAAKALRAANIAAVAGELSAVGKSITSITAAAKGDSALANAAIEMGLFGAAAGGTAAEIKKLGLEELESHIKAVANGFDSAGISAAYVARKLTASIDETAGGRWRQFYGTLANIVVTFGRASAGFIAANPALTGLIAGVVAATAAIGYFAFEAYRANQVFEQFKNSLALTGSVQLTDQEISNLSETIRNLSGVSADEAKKVIASFGAMQNGSKAIFEAMAADVAAISSARDIKPEEAAKELENLFSKPFDAADRLTKIVGDLTEGERELLNATDASLDPARAQAAIQTVLIGHLAKLREAREKDIELQIKALKLEGESPMTPEDVGAIDARIGTLEKELQTVRAINEEAKKQAGILDATASSADALRARFDDVLKSIAPWTTELEKAQAAIAALQTGLQGATGDAAALVKHFEGFSATAYKDSDGRYRVGYGSDTTTDESGQKHAVTSDTMTTVADAERDLSRRIVEFQVEAAKEIGPAWEKLTDQAKASITSVTYNYGHVPSGVIAAARTGDNAGIASAIGTLGSDNGGVNARRRLSEAANVSGQSAVVTDPTKVKQANEAIAEQEDRVLGVNQAKAGGTEIDKAQLDNLKASLAGRRNEVAEQEHLIAGIEKQLSLVKSTQEQARLERQLLEARVELQNKQNAAKEADLRLGSANARGTGDADTEHASAVALAEFKMSLYAKDSAQYKSALAEKMQADNAYAESQKRVAMQGASDSLREVQQSTAHKIQQYELEVKARQITEGQKNAYTLAALNDEITQERSILNQELALDNLRPQERKRITDELKLIEQNYADAVKKVQLQAADETMKKWQSIGQSIMGSFNSSLRGILTGTTSWSSAMKNIGLDLTMKLIEHFEQIVESWVLGENAKTAATTSGETERTSAMATGVATQKAVNSTTVMGDAGRAAAGTYAALAGIPLIGPVIAPPAAAAAFGAVEAFGSFDIGAWNLPSNQLAMVHKNELVMPAAEAGAFRNMLTGAANGSGPSGSGVVHNHTWNISALDSRSFVQALSEHSSPLSRIIRDSFNSNPSLRPSY